MIVFYLSHVFVLKVFHGMFEVFHGLPQVFHGLSKVFYGFCKTGPGRGQAKLTACLSKGQLGSGG